MKKLILSFTACSIIFSVSILLMFSGCHKTDNNDNGDNSSDTPFQGPQNPSFETEGGGQGAYWSTLVPTANHIPSRATGSGFMPSNGVWYEYMGYGKPTSVNYWPTDMYQDNVDLTQSTSMTFDYSFSGSFSDHTKSATVWFMFTSSGTDTLWEKTIDSTNASVQVLNETISLPATTIAGRFKIFIDYVPHSVSAPNGVFSIDNIRVQ